jgi:hypothetical protein
MTYTLTAVKETASGAFTANINLDGKKVGSVENDGRGGSNLYWFIKPEYRADFEGTAADELPDEDFEVADAYTYRLLTLAAIARTRNVVFVENIEKMHQTGEYSKFGTSDFDGVLNHLRSTGRTGFVFSKTVGGFIAV